MSHRRPHIRNNSSPWWLVKHSWAPCMICPVREEAGEAQPPVMRNDPMMVTRNNIGIPQCIGIPLSPLSAQGSNPHRCLSSVYKRFSSQFVVILIWHRWLIRPSSTTGSNYGMKWICFLSSFLVERYKTHIKSWTLKLYNQGLGWFANTLDVDIWEVLLFNKILKIFRFQLSKC